jgi:outer membrane protein assembly factor BamB
MEGESMGFEDFSVEMGDFMVKPTGKYDRIQRISTGGSVDTRALIHDNKVYFGCFNHRLHCLDARTGQLIWKFKARDRIGICSPVERNDVIYIGSYDRFMYALDAQTGQMKWKFETRNMINGDVIVHGDTVYFGSMDRFFYALNADDGTLKWKFETQDVLICGPTFFENMVLFGSYDKNFYCLDKDTGRLIWKLKTEQEIINTGDYAILDGHIYLGSYDNLLRKIEIRTGNVLWKKRTGQYGVVCGTVLYKDMILVPTDDGNMLAFDLDGNIRWKFTTTKPVGYPTVANGKIYFTCEDFNLYCISLEGKLIWKFRTQEMNWWCPTIWEGRVYFGSYDCHFYVLDGETGRVVWKFRTDGAPSNYPPPYEHFELVTTADDSGLGEEKSEKRYEVQMEKEEDLDTYKSRITYQISTQYAAKGKYQIDSLEEEF